MYQIIGDLQSNGLLVEVEVGLSAPKRDAMYRKGRVVPPAVKATFIIDTGADSTMVDESIVRALQLTPTGQTRVLSSTAGGVPVPCNVYDVSLEVVNHSGMPPWRMSVVEVLGRSLLNQSTQGMLGRDILDRGVLIYDGPARKFKLTYR